MKEKLIKTLRWIWEFPQCFLGIILIIIYKAEYISIYKKIKYYISNKIPGAISCGLYVIIHPNLYANKKYILHEWGHTRQSLYFGWLYLPFIGIRSGIHALLHNKICNKFKNYTHYWVEKWANKLGGIKYDGK